MIMMLVEHSMSFVIAGILGLEIGAVTVAQISQAWQPYKFQTYCIRVNIVHIAMERIHAYMI